MPGNARKISSREPIEDSAHKYFHTEALEQHDALASTLGQGFWIDVPPGRESHIDYDPNLVQESADKETLKAGEKYSALSLDELIRLKAKQLAELDKLISHRGQKRENFNLVFFWGVSTVVFSLTLTNVNL